jgi:hypothetical protein
MHQSETFKEDITVCDKSKNEADDISSKETVVNMYDPVHVFQQQMHMELDILEKLQEDEEKKVDSLSGIPYNVQIKNTANNMVSELRKIFNELCNMYIKHIKVQNNLKGEFPFLIDAWEERCSGRLSNMNRIYIGNCKSIEPSYYDISKKSSTQFLEPYTIDQRVFHFVWNFLQQTPLYHIFYKKKGNFKHPYVRIAMYASIRSYTSDTSVKPRQLERLDLGEIIHDYSSLNIKNKISINRKNKGAPIILFTLQTVQTGHCTIL